MQALFLAFLLLTKKNKRKADIILILWLPVIASNLFIKHLVEDHEVFSWILIVFNYALFLLHAPLFYAFTKALTDDAPDLNMLKYFKTVLYKFRWLHLLPFIITFIAISLLIKDSGEPEFLLQDNSGLWQRLFLYGSLLIGLSYLGIIFRLLKKRDINILNKYSYNDEPDLTWLKHFSLGIIGIWLIHLISRFAAAQFSFVTYADSDVMTYYAITGMLFFVGYHGYKYSGIEENKETKIDYTPKKEKSNEVSENEILKLQAFMENEKPYLNSKLTIKELALQIKIPTSDLSKIINEKLNMNFFDFINKYRVKEFKKQVNLPENKNYTIQAIAFQCGFNSKSSFYNIFKSHTGQTPAKYKSGNKVEHSLTDSKTA